MAKILRKSQGSVSLSVFVGQNRYDVIITFEILTKKV